MQALLSLDRETARRQMRLALSDTNPATAIETLLIPTMERIGVLWEQGEVALSQVYMSGRICEGILDELLPVAETTEAENQQVVITVFEDSHALGKRLVVSALRVARIPVRDYGLGVTLEDLVKKVREDRPQVLLISVLMLRSALRVAEKPTKSFWRSCWKKAKRQPCPEQIFESGLLFAVECGKFSSIPYNLT